MPRITISYRRDDSGVITGRIFDRLTAHYGREAVFRDIDDIPPGTDFRKHISDVLDKSDVVLAIVGPKWVGPRANQNRLTNAADPVRVEIEAALRKDRPLIPVLVLRGNMPRPEQLPDSMLDFAYRHAVSVDAGQDFDVHMMRLVRAMDRLLAFNVEPEAATPDERKLEGASPAGDFTSAVDHAISDTSVDPEIPQDPAEVGTLRAANAALEAKVAALSSAQQTAIQQAKQHREEIAAVLVHYDQEAKSQAAQLAEAQQLVATLTRERDEARAQADVCLVDAKTAGNHANASLDAARATIAEQSKQIEELVKRVEELQLHPSFTQSWGSPRKLIAFGTAIVALLLMVAGLIAPHVVTRRDTAYAQALAASQEKVESQQAMIADLGRRLNLALETLASRQSGSDQRSITGTNGAYDQGTNALHRGDYLEAIRQFKIAAAQDDPSAQFSLGYMYETGEGTSMDLLQARHWYEEAAIRGNKMAARKLESFQFRSR